MEKAYKIFCQDNSERMEFDSVNRGYRGDIYVQIEEATFQLNIYDIVRLKQDFEEEINTYGYFSIEPNVVIVKEVNKIEIKNLVEILYKQKYFDSLKPIDRARLKKESLTPLL